MMPHLLTRFVASSVATVGAVAGSAAGDLLESHQVSLSTMFAVAGVVAPAAWYLSSKLTKIDDRLDKLEGSLESLPCNATPKPKDHCHPK